MDEIKLRRATVGDAKRLYDWRNDSATRDNSLSHEPVGWEPHLKWLERCLADPCRALYIAEITGAVVGTVRADFDGREYELSWTVAPEQRGKGLGLGMVRALIDTLPADACYQATVLQGNEASHRIAQAVGMQVAEGSGSGIRYYGGRVLS